MHRGSQFAGVIQRFELVDRKALQRLCCAASRTFAGIPGQGRWPAATEEIFQQVHSGLMLTCGITFSRAVTVC